MLTIREEIKINSFVVHFGERLISHLSLIAPAYYGNPAALSKRGTAYITWAEDVPYDKCNDNEDIQKLAFSWAEEKIINEFRELISNGNAEISVRSFEVKANENSWRIYFRACVESTQEPISRDYCGNKINEQN